MTAAIGRLTYELMLEQERQERIAYAEAQGKSVAADVWLQQSQPDVYRWLKSGWFEVKY